MSDHRSPAFQFYPKDWLSDSNVKAMSLDARGAYIELLCLYWLHDGLPTSTDRLARLVGVAPAKFRRLWPQIEPCFTVEGDRLHQKRMDKERAKQLRFKETKSAAGKAGAGSRWHSQPSANGSAIGLPMAKDSFSFPSSSPLTEERKTERTRHPVERPDGPKRNPLVQANRDEWERESLALTGEIRDLRLARHRAGGKLAPDEPTDGAEIFVAAAKYEGALRQKCNPANMTDDRLLNTVLDLRATAQAEREKAGKVPA